VVNIFSGFQNEIIGMNCLKCFLLISTFQNSSCLFVNILSSDKSIFIAIQIFKEIFNISSGSCPTVLAVLFNGICWYKFSDQITEFNFVKSFIFLIQFVFFNTSQSKFFRTDFTIIIPSEFIKSRSQFLFSK